MLMLKRMIYYVELLDILKEINNFSFIELEEDWQMVREKTSRMSRNSKNEREISGQKIE